MQDLSWNDLRYVLAIGRTGSLAASARTLRVDETTVSRRVVAAERALGARLFHRMGGALIPTEIGERVIKHAERVELNVDELKRVATGADTKTAGTVRVTSIPLLVNRVLVPALGPLLGEHPDLQVELVSEPRNLDVTKREADIALRPARPHREQRATARRIANLSYGVFARSGADADSLPWISFEEAWHRCRTSPG